MHKDASVSTGNGHTVSQGMDPSLSSIFIQLWIYKYRVLVLMLVCGMIAILTSYLMKPIYTAQVTLLPQNQSLSINLFGSFTRMAGLPLGPVESYEGLYGEIIKSDRILDELIAMEWEYSEATQPVTLFEVFSVSSDHSDEQDRRLAVFALKNAIRNRMIQFTRDKLSGYMKIEVSVPHDPLLAATIANHIVDSLNEFNSEVSRYHASEQLQLVERRMLESSSSLEAAEDELTAFEEANRSYDSSPVLFQRFRHLKREVEAHTTIWIELRRQFEVSRLEEQKESMTIEILDRASTPARRSSPIRSLMALLASAAGFIVAVLYIVFRMQWSMLRTSRGK